MQIDRITLALRPRTAWEAMDLGTALLRRHAGTTWRAWLLASLAVWVPVAALLWWGGTVMWPLLVLMWWLKPVFDRIVLYVLSQAAFGEPVRTVDAALAGVRFGRRRLLADLTWRRIGLGRALIMPVGILEGVHGDRLRRRRQAIAGHGGGAVSALTLLCMHFEAAIALGLLMLVPLLTPDVYLQSLVRHVYALASDGLPAGWWLGMAGITWIAISVVEPFYVAAGFGIYLNSRVHLEAWDIELVFRRMARRLQHAAGAGLLLVALASGWLLPATPAHAADADPAPSTPLRDVYPRPVDDPRFVQAHADAYLDPLLRPVRTQTEWQRRETPAGARTRLFDPEVLGQLLRGLMLVLEVLAWALAIGVAGWLLWVTRHWWARWWRADTPRERPAPTPVTITPENHDDVLPEAIVANARRLWSQGAPRAALSLLYRAAVQALNQRLQGELPPGSTEARCLRAARTLPDPADRETFAQVVHAWQRAAYAHALPGEDAFHALLTQAAERFGWRS